MTIGQRIRERRKEKHLTMKDIFDQENISTGNLSELEHDKYLPSVQTLISLGRSLDCSIDWILTGEEHHSGEDKSLNIEALKSEQGLLNDGSPLTDEEADMIAMYRLLPSGAREETFDYVYFKYERFVERKRESIYSTYAVDESRRKSGSDDDDTRRGTA